MLQLRSVARAAARLSLVILIGCTADQVSSVDIPTSDDALFARRGRLSITVSIDSSTLRVGGTTTARATVRDRWGNVLADRAVTWSSGDTSVAVVTPSGVVTAKASGSAAIRAATGGYAGSAMLFVLDGPSPIATIATVSVSLSASAVDIGQTSRATATLRDSVGNVLTGREVLWSSSAPAIAAVSQAGDIVAASSGTATILATSEGRSGSAIIVVNSPSLALSFTTQPGAIGISGSVLVPQPVLQLRTSSGAVVNQGGVSVTAAIATGGGTLSGTTTVATTASGVASFTNLVITGTAGTRTLSFSAPGYAPAISAAITISVPVVGLDAEPSFNSASQVMMWQDEFDGYGTFTDMIAAGWRTANGASTQDVTTNAGGANLLIAPGFDGTGKAMRLRYDGISNGSGQEGHSWSRSTLGAANAAGGPGDVNAGKPGKTFYISYYFRIVPGGGHPLDSTRRIVKVKWLELWNSTDGNRAQFSTGYAVCGRGDVPFLGGDGTGTLWHFYGNSGGTTTCNAHQVKPPFAHSGAGKWHRVTHRYVTRSAASARDGIAQMWYDGTLIVSVGQGYCGVAVPGGVNTGTIKPPRWCENEDLDQMYVNEYVRRITFGSIQTYTLWPFSIDIDRVMLWRDP
jgi:hypothetical protein